MGKQMGYWIDLSALKLDDSGASWIQLMPLGTYQHPTYGEIAITPDRVRNFAQNVKAKTRGQDLDIDYDHKERSGEAAGWLKDAEARGDGLWGLVEWTQAAAEKIKSKAYRYFSPEFVDEWEHPKTKQTHHDVLFGGALTNRPFLKDIMPINMSEVFSADRQLENGGGASMAGMSSDEVVGELAKILKLPDGSSAEQVLGAMRVLEQQAGADETGSGASQDATGTAQGGSQDATGTAQSGQPQGGSAQQHMPVAANEGRTQEVIRLAEQSKDPAVQALAEWAKAQALQASETQKQLSETQAALRLSETATMVSKLSEGKKVILTPVAEEATRELLMVLPKQLSEKVTNFVKLFTEGKATVQLGEIGGRPASEEMNAVKAFTDVVSSIVEKDKLSYGDAVERAAALHPQLFADYRDESYSFKV